MTTRRVLPADVYDTFEFSALAFDGIGKGKWFEDVSAIDPIPVCIAGHAYAVDPTCTLRWRLSDWNLSTTTNDKAVSAINTHRHRPLASRVSWKEYVRELNIVRGD